MREPAPDVTPLDPRVPLAAERTVLAWFRTGTALMGLGFVVARFGLFLREMALVNGAAVEPRTNASTVGVVIVGAGVVVNIWASLRHVRMMDRLKRGLEAEITARGPAALGFASGVGGLILVVILLVALVK